VGLLGIQFAQHDPLAVEGDEVPVFTLLIGEFEEGLGLLFGIESLQEITGSSTHVQSRISSMDERGSQENSSKCEMFLHDRRKSAMVIPEWKRNILLMAGLLRVA
jgi:hypothetical protein